LIEASAPGFERWSLKVQVGEDRERREVVVPKLRVRATPKSSAASNTAESATKSSVSSSAQAQSSSLGTQKVVGIVTAGVGLIPLGISGYFAVRAKNLDNDPPDPKCPNNSCAIEAGRIATGFFIAGAALVAGGAVLYFTAPTKKSASISIRSNVAADGFGLTLAGTY
jgi:hypothetical protein